MSRGQFTTEQRFWAKVQRGSPDDCWEWKASRFPNGYGRFWLCGRPRGAHRIAYEVLVGPIPDGLTLDHLCRNRACVNPSHLKAVTNRENILRGVSPWAQHARQAACLRGHPFDAQNTYTGRGWRECRQCRAERSRRYYAARRAS